MEDKYTAADLKKKLILLGKSTIIEIYKDLKINLVNDNASDEALSEDLIRKIEQDKVKSGELILLLEYIYLYPRINYLLKEDIVDLFPTGRLGRITQKEEMISHIKNLLIHHVIDIEHLKKKVAIKSILFKIGKIENLDHLVSLVSKVGDKVEDPSNKKSLIGKISDGLETGKFSPEDLEKYLNEIKIADKVKKRSSTERTGNLLKEIEGLKTHITSIEKELDNQKNILQSFSNSLEKTQEISRSTNILIKTHFDKFEGNFNIGRTERLIAAIRRENLNLTGLNSQTFDALKVSLKKDNISDVELIRDGIAIMTIDYVMKLTREMDWEINLDLFYRILSEEIMKLGSTTNFSAKIPVVRDFLCKRMNIGSKKFDSLLLDCREKGWVLLEVGTPIGETDAGWLDTGKNRFYYVKLQKK